MSSLITDITQATPDWLTLLFQEKGYLHTGTVVDITLLKSFETNISNVYHLAVCYSRDSQPLFAPIRLFLKIPTSDFTGHNKEIEFYTMIAPAMRQAHPQTDLPFLHCYDAAYSFESDRSHLLLEDVSTTHFTADVPTTLTRKHFEQVIDAYACFHTYWWEHPRLGQDIGERLTASTIDSFINLAQQKFDDFVNFVGEGLTKQQLNVLTRVVTAWPFKRKERLVHGKGITLVHRDPHPLNFLYPYDLSQATVKLIDWQSWRVDTGTDDLAYMMAACWPLEHRTRMEHRLLKRYYERLVAFGVKDYTWDDCCYDYQASIIRCLFFLMVAWFPAQWERGWWWERVERGMLAYEDLGCIELLKS